MLSQKRNLQEVFCNFCCADDHFISQCPTIVCRMCKRRGHGAYSRRCLLQDTNPDPSCLTPNQPSSNGSVPTHQTNHDEQTITGQGRHSQANETTIEANQEQAAKGAEETSHNQVNRQKTKKKGMLLVPPVITLDEEEDEVKLGDSNENNDIQLLYEHLKKCQQGSKIHIETDVSSTAVDYVKMCAEHKASLLSSVRPEHDMDVEILFSKQVVNLSDSDHSQSDGSENELEILSTNILPTLGQFQRKSDRQSSS